MRALVLICAGLCAAVLAACGSSASTTTRGRLTSPSSRHLTLTVTHTRAAATSSTTTSSTVSPPATTSSPTSSASGAMCVAADLSLSFLGGQGATGHGELSFALRNTSSSSCRTGGYPGVLFLDGAGRGLPTTPQHTTDDFFGHTTLRELTVAQGATVSFRLGVSHVGTGGSDAGCVSAKGLQVIAPNDTATMRVGVTGGIAECGGTVTVSPLQPGRSAVSST